MDSRIIDITPKKYTNEKPDTVPDDLQPGDKIAYFGIFDISHGEANTNIPIMFVASIRHHYKFKVYYGFGDRMTPEMVAVRGAKVKDEEFARSLFPMLGHLRYSVT